MIRKRNKKQLLEDLAKAHERIREFQEKLSERQLVENIVRAQEQLLQRSLKVREQERGLIAYEIHDGLCQQLAAAQMQLGTFDRLREKDRESAQVALDCARSLIGQAVIESRRLINGLRPAILDICGIVAAIHQLISESKHAWNLQVEFFHNLDDERLPSELEIVAYRIIQEGLTNARRHSTCNEIQIELIRKDGQLRIVVRDEGVGFDLRTVRESSLGLAGIRERARLFGGEAAIKSAPGKGTRITVKLPIVHGSIQKLYDGMEPDPSSC